MLLVEPYRQWTAFRPDALLAAEAVRCGGEQGQLQTSNLVRYASALKLDVDRFQHCLDSEKYKEQIQASAREAVAKGATGTPTFGTPAFVIGKREKNETVEGEMMIGAFPFAVFEQKLKALPLQ